LALHANTESVRIVPDKVVAKSPFHNGTATQNTDNDIILEADFETDNDLWSGKKPQGHKNH
jgi:hypothetical protein